MPDPAGVGFTDRQLRWFASVREGLERNTGRSLEAWAEIARACPEQNHRARLSWMKSEHGLAQNRASLVLQEAFPAPRSWSNPEALALALWSDPKLAAILEEIRRSALRLDNVVIGQRKGFTAFSRKVQFAAAKPAKSSVMLGLALPTQFDARLQPAGRDGWSERLLSRLLLNEAAEVDAHVAMLLREAWARS